MKFSIFNAEKNLCILHGQVFVMGRFRTATNTVNHSLNSPNWYCSYYENTSMYYTYFSYVVKIKNFLQKIFDIFLMFAQNINCGYTLEPPRRGGSNEYPQTMFWSKNKKNR